MEERFDGKSVPWLKDFLTKRGIQVSDQRRSKLKAELVALAVKAREMKLQRLDEDNEDTSDVITSKLNTEKGAIPRPENIQSWSYDFSKIPPFTFADLYTYLIDSGEYTPENLKSFKVAQCSFQHFPRRRFLMGHNYYSLSIDATIMVSKYCPITSKHVGIIFVTQ